MLLHEKLKPLRLVLGSASPRRQQLLQGLGLTFQVRINEVEENFPVELQREQIPVYLAEKKSAAALDQLAEDELLITADTVVWLDGRVLNKPSDLNEAKQMLHQIAGKTHEVITAVCLRDIHKSHTFYVVSEVSFRALDDEMIGWYVNNYRPLDKAGAYGVQEWIGYVGVNDIKGSFFNVMGLPLHELYAELMAF
jgi:septum formation protein